MEDLIERTYVTTVITIMFPGVKGEKIVGTTMHPLVMVVEEEEEKEKEEEEEEEEKK